MLPVTAEALGRVAEEAAAGLACCQSWPGKQAAEPGRQGAEQLPAAADLQRRRRWRPHRRRRHYHFHQMHPTILELEPPLPGPEQVVRHQSRADRTAEQLAAWPES